MMAERLRIGRPEPHYTGGRQLGVNARFSKASEEARMSRNEVVARLSKLPFFDEIRRSTQGLFSIEHGFERDILGSKYTVYFAKPTKRIKNGLFIDRELAVIIADFSDIQARTIQAAQKLIQENSPRLFPSYVAIIHSDPRGNATLRTWGRENNLSVLPLFRASSGLPEPEELERRLSMDIHSIDPFDVSVAVADDRDFFGRRDEALTLARQLEAGQVKSLFALRKVGKTSILDRAVKVARENESMCCIVADCSKDFVWQKNATQVLSLLKGTIAKAINSSLLYSAIDERNIWGTRTDSELFELMDKASRPTALFLDEIDYLTPSSPTDPVRWANEFNPFWRQLRGFVQEAHRRTCRVGLLVCGVSSKWFREETVGGVENAALALVPEVYLAPFARRASIAMLRDLGKRCGLRFSESAANVLAEYCGDLPYWMRKCGAFIHRKIGLDVRPLDLTPEIVRPLMSQFIADEADEIVLPAIKTFIRYFPELQSAIVSLGSGSPIPAQEFRILSKYGLVGGTPERPVTCELVRPMFMRVPERLVQKKQGDHPPESPSIRLSETEWAEELGLIGKRRNILERRLREVVASFLQMAHLAGTIADTPHAAVLEAVDKKRRSELDALDTRAITDKLHFLELTRIVTKNWAVFERLFGDKTHLETAVQTVNIRPDAHAKAADLADIARQRDALDWLESKIRF